VTHSNARALCPPSEKAQIADSVRVRGGRSCCEGWFIFTIRCRAVGSDLADAYCGMLYTWQVPEAI
jgi:hypothetical protein